MGEQQSKIFDIDLNIVVNLGIKCNTLGISLAQKFVIIQVRLITWIQAEGLAEPRFNVHRDGKLF